MWLMQRRGAVEVFAGGREDRTMFIRRPRCGDAYLRGFLGTAIFAPDDASNGSVHRFADRLGFRRFACLPAGTSPDDYPNL